MKTTTIKNSFAIIAGILFLNNSNAQMFVSPNTSVFVNNEVVFIKNELELNGATSNFYLRKDAQLLQGSTAASTNSGVGSLSVFQEGSSNNFQYNYWCSPVGGNIVTAGNSPFGVTQLKDIVDLTNSNNPTILASNNYNGTASPFGIAPYWIWKFVSSINYADWIFVGSASTINAGEGFTMKGTSGTNVVTVNGVQNNPGSSQRYDFRGKPNDGTISIPVLAGKLTLTGNPYPSAIDLALFLTTETNSTGVAYFWEQDKTSNSHYIGTFKGGYGTYSPLGGSGNGVYTPATFYTYDGSGNPGAAAGTGIVYERRFSPVGQGFMIEGSVSGNVQMKNNYRVYVKEGVGNFSQFEKTTNTDKKSQSTGFMEAIPSVSGYDYTEVSTAPAPQIRFSALLNNQGVRQIVLAFLPEATDGVDRGMDAVSASTDLPVDAYFTLDNKEFLINALDFDSDKKIPVGFRNTNQANFKFTVNEILNFETQNIFLHDKIDDIYYDIKNSFCELTLPAGVNNTQYEITFKKAVTLGVENPENKSFVLYQNNSAKSLTVSNPLQMDLATCSLYDVTGKLIFSKTDLGSNTSYNFSTSGLSDGIYIVKLATKDKVEIGQKIIVRN